MDFDFSFQVIGLIFTIVSWCIVGFVASRFYKKMTNKPKGWKIFIVLLVGLFSFTLNIPFFDTVLRISILPLGVGLLYWVTRKRNWEKYRRFAWLGFFANYLFLLTFLLSFSVQHLFYPEDQLATYLGSVDDAKLIETHSSAAHRLLDIKSLQEQVPKMNEVDIFSLGSYAQDVNMEQDPNKKNERFPYQLTGTSPKWGSGIKTSIYVESDGKGLLVTTPKKQVYFRTEKSFLTGGK